MANPTAVFIDRTCAKRMGKGTHHAVDVFEHYRDRYAALQMLTPRDLTFRAPFPSIRNRA